MFYNNIDMSEHIRIIDIRGRGLAEQELTTIRPTGSDEDYVVYRNKPKRYIEIDYEIRAYDKESLRKKIDRVSPLFFTKGEVPVVFLDEQDRTYFCEYDGVTENLEHHHIGIHRGTIFLLRDKHKYGPEQSYRLEDISTVENKGTAPTEPVFELTAKEKATFAMVSSGGEDDAEYNIIGVPADVDAEIVDARNTIFYERGDTLGQWDAPGADFDNGKVTGDQLGTDGTGIHPLSYGDPGDWDKWYGPALMREINPIQDFEVEMRLRVNTNRPDELYRIEFYLYDEYMNVLGKMAIRDFSLTTQRHAAEGRFGEFKGAGINYMISQANYLREASHFHGMVRMRRIGNEFRFYVARLKTGEDEGLQHDILEMIYRDTNNQYQGRLKFVQINIARHAQGLRASVPRINAIKVTELKQVTVDQTPYILDVGDIVTFDHKNKDILINGEPRNDLKNFGGSFFDLKKGNNELIVTPAGVFDSRVTYRDKYL